MISLDTSVLLGYYNAKTNLALAGLGSSSIANSSSSSSAAAGKDTDPVPTAPWANAATSPNASALAKKALAGHSLIDVNAAQLDVKGASDDYKNLFALYSGIDALQGLADMATQKNVSALQLSQIQKAFANGMKEINAYVGGLKLDQVRLTTGEKLSTDKTTVGVPATNASYTTRPIYTGDASQEVPAFQGAVSFNISVKQVNTTKNVAIDLGDMGSTPRTLNNVVSYINGKLQEQGILSRFAVDKLPPQPRTYQVGDKTVTLPDGPPSYALKINGESSEVMTFSADATAGAVYVSQTAGAPPVTTTTTTNGVVKTTTTGAQTQQLIKIQTDTSDTATQPPSAVMPDGQTYGVDGKVFGDTLDTGVVKVHQTVTGSDGSLYVLADVKGTVDGQPVQGAQDVALMKYDSAGNLLYTRTLGAAGTASGLGLAVSSDGKVAVAGSITGALDPGSNGIDATKSDSFVTVYDAQGQEQWTARRGALQDDQATAVAFGADGAVYVAGQTKSSIGGATPVGGQDGYLQAFTWNGLAGDKSKVTPVFSTQFGSAQTDKVSGIAINGNSVVIAGTDGPDAVVRQFTLNGANPPTLIATRDLGDLQGGSVVGVGFDSNGKVIVAGTAHNGALNAGTVGHPSSGGSEAFVARLDSGLAPSAGDMVSYFGGSGEDTATGMAIQGTDVWLTGQVGSGSDIPGTTAVGSKDGYVARIDPSTGATEFVRRFSATQGQTIPTTIAVDSSGSSALDRLGLPKGTLLYKDSQLITAQTSLRAGDQFAVRSREGGTTSTVTIAANDTMDTLAQKVARASGFQATVTVVTVNGYRQLSIKPVSGHATVEIVPGPAGKDAAGPLGLKLGVVQSLITDPSLDTKTTYGLKLNAAFDLSTADGAKAASDAMLAAMSTIRSAYNTLKNGAQPEATKKPGKTDGTVPAYLSTQISNYQAALDRLTGGGS